MAEGFIVTHPLPASVSRVELSQALSEEGHGIQLDMGNALGNQLDRNQLVGVAGNLAAGQSKGIWEERGRMLPRGQHGSWARTGPAG